MINPILEKISTIHQPVTIVDNNSYPVPYNAASQIILQLTY
jgi:PHD/YefM family antitoxin component YafN of YafNO toxin-antitoxin module